MRGATVVEALPPCLGDDYRIGLVPMVVIGAAGKTGAQTLQPCDRRFDDEEVSKTSHRLVHERSRPPLEGR